MDIREEEVKRIRVALESMAASLKKFVDEGVTIYTHEEGYEQHN